MTNETLLAAANAATEAVGRVMLPKLRPVQAEDGFGQELSQMLAAIETVQAKGREALDRR